MSDLVIVEDMTFADYADSTVQPLSVRVENVDEGKVSVVYERDIIDNAGRGGVVRDIEEVGRDIFDEEAVQQMVAEGTWSLTSAPAPSQRRDDDA